MRKHLILIGFVSVLLGSCTTTEKLAYLNNLDHSGLVGDEYFTMEVPDYKIQTRDILHISIKYLTHDGNLKDFLATSVSGTGTNYAQGEAGQFIYGYDVGSDGTLTIPVLGTFKVADKTLEETRRIIQAGADSLLNRSVVECKLLSFKFTVIGEVRTPGTYINYNNYLTVLEAIGRAGGVSDFGRRDKILVIRPVDGGTRTYALNLQNKGLLSSDGYFILPNDVIIVSAESKKVFNLNIPTYTFVLTSITSVITTTLLLVNYLGK